MKQSLLPSLFFLLPQVLLKDFIDLNPAYYVTLEGTQDFHLLSEYTKDPIFVEGFQMLDDTTLLQSAGLYSASELQLIKLDHTQKNT